MNEKRAQTKVCALKKPVKILHEHPRSETSAICDCVSLNNDIQHEIHSFLFGIFCIIHPENYFVK